ncbi:hypothetical protein Taro_030527 [Colocasia esculenta]|uniref:Uncharacterized protein n=1 Tax=Colocasia esculenta TaxID=4460 RepID=A0A843VLM3_COLES|nr:hypothetical protein [Colocasia esculenta]
MLQIDGKFEAESVCSKTLGGYHLHDGHDVVAIVGVYRCRGNKVGHLLDGLLLCSLLRARPT